MRTTSRLLAGTALALPLFSQAGVVYQNPYSSPDTGICTSCDGHYRVWDQFDVDQHSFLTGIDARLTMPSARSIEFSIWDPTLSFQIYSKTVNPWELDVTPGYIDGLGDYYDVSVKIELPLAAGSYYLSIYDGDTLSTLGWVNCKNTAKGRSIQTWDGKPGVPDLTTNGNGRDMMFRIHGMTPAVPEPGSVALVLAGAGVMAFKVRRALNKA